MKRIFSIILAVLLMAGCLIACSTIDSANNESNNNKENKIRIVTTIFPEYDWVNNVLGDNPSNIDVIFLLDNSVDLHSYQTTAEDILNISTCDLFIYVGGESDEWVEDALNEATNKNMTVISLMDVLSDRVKEEELVEGMEEEEVEGDDSEEAEDEYDEHIWLSLKNAAIAFSEISQGIQSIDPDNEDYYKSNTEEYLEKLNTLDDKYQEELSDTKFRTLVFGDRFPFRYLVDDYGISYYAAFAGCSAETEASFETIKFLADKVDELQLHSVMAIEGTDHKIAETIVDNTESKDQQILVLDSMQGTISKDVKDGVTYLSVMEGNLEVIRAALE